MTFRVTYSALNADMTELHAAFDQALASVRQKLGKDHPSWIGGKPFESGRFLEDRNPADTRELLARFHVTPTTEVDRVLTIAHRAQRDWARRPWKDRAALIRKAADLISERRLELSAIMALETGKSRLEALGDVEESADLFRYYAGQLEEANGFLKPLGKLSPNEDTRSVLRPYGVFVVVAPFNFPLALAAGMAGGALLGGNAVVMKPSHETPWCGAGLFAVLRDAGLPDGLFQVVYGPGSELGAALTLHPGTDGIVFTGSKQVGMRIMHEFTRAQPKPCFLEMGGKNPAIVCADADLAKAVEGVARSAFGLSGQKCSALSRLYVHESRKAELLERLVARTKELVIGVPTRADVYMGPVINEAAFKRYAEAASDAKRDGKVLYGAESLKTQGPLAHGWFVAPTIVELPRGHRLFKEELFLPFLAVDTFTTLDEAIKEANDCEYGLTAGIFSENEADVDRFMDELEAGVLYANRQTGATTGAWPGVQAFCGWKGSGSTGKGGCGPYYVQQFMREQSQTRML